MTNYTHITDAMLKKMLKQLQAKVQDPANHPEADIDLCEQQIENINNELRDRGY